MIIGTTDFVMVLVMAKDFLLLSLVVQTQSVSLLLSSELKSILGDHVGVGKCPQPPTLEPEMTIANLRIQSTIWVLTDETLLQGRLRVELSIFDIPLLGCTSLTEA